MSENLTSNFIEDDELNQNDEESDYNNLIVRLKEIKSNIVLLEKTIINEGVSIGSGSTILCGIEIGVNTMIGAGSVVTKNIKASATAYGNPAKEKK